MERISALTDIDGLTADSTLLRGGLSMMLQGDFLNPHIDNSHGPGGLYRRLNLLYYCTPEWRREDGGNLELWDEAVTRPLTIHSKFNRLVIMVTDRTSWHSVSPIAADRARCCLSSYYYSRASPDGSDYHHVTSFTGRPGQVALRKFSAIDNTAREFAKRWLGAGRPRDRQAA